MKDYKRFTERVDSGFVSELDCRIAYNKLCAIEDKIENGTLVELPCKVGDTVYYVEKGIIYELKVIYYNFFKTNNSLYAMDDTFFGRQLNFNEFNITWFLTKAEAEQIRTYSYSEEDVEEKGCEDLLGLSFIRSSQ